MDAQSLLICRLCIQLYRTTKLPARPPQRRTSCLYSSGIHETVRRCTEARWPPPAGGCWSGQGGRERPRMGRPIGWCRGTLLGQAWRAIWCHRQQPSWALSPGTPQLQREKVGAETGGPVSYVNSQSSKTSLKWKPSPRTRFCQTPLPWIWLAGNWRAAASAGFLLEKAPKVVLGIVFKSHAVQDFFLLTVALFIHFNTDSDQLTFAWFSAEVLKSHIESYNILESVEIN